MQDPCNLVYVLSGKDCGWMHWAFDEVEGLPDLEHGFYSRALRGGALRHQRRCRCIAIGAGTTGTAPAGWQIMCGDVFDDSWMHDADGDDQPCFAQAGHTSSKGIRARVAFSRLSPRVRRYAGQ